MNDLAIIFDLDGTLWDSRKTCIKAYNEILNLNLDVEYLDNIMGKTTPEIIKTIFNEVNKDNTNKYLKVLQKENELLKELGGELYEDVINTLKELSKTNNLYIVSNCDVGYIDTFLDYYKINNLFKDIECFGNTNNKKPDNIKLLIKRNNIKKAIYIGDTNSDLEAAKINNLDFIYCSYGFGEVDEYTYKIDKFNELLNIIKELNN